MIESVDTLLDDLGGTGAVAEHFGLSASVVSGWRKRGVPSTRWMALCALAKARGVKGVTVEAMAALHAAPARSMAEART